MTTTVTTEITARIRAFLSQTDDHSTPQATVDVNKFIQLASGNGSNQANLVFEDQRTIAASSSETLDLNGGGLLDDLGNAVNFSAVKAILIIASPQNTNDVVVGNAGSNPFVGPLGGTTPTHTIKPGGFMLWANPVSGWAVTGGSNDQLKVANSSSGSGVTYDIVILGA